MTNANDSKIGTVHLVGAGPGDPGMVTLRAVECLERADVVLHDYLVNPRVLRHVRPGAEIVCLGRHGHGRIWTQAEIDDQLVVLANAGKKVVRLKGGDPAVFARGAEEAEHLATNGIPFEIVPGITTALAAGSCAGIPITHRDFASCVALITGQEWSEKENASLDFEALARFPGTLVFYMGVTSAKKWSTDLVAAGKSPQTPSAIIRRCSFPDQISIRCTLGEVAERLTEPHRIRPPAIVIVGEVTNLAPTLSWFEKRPLFGQRILVTRPIDQAEKLYQRLSELGADVLEQPAIHISEPPDWRPVDDALDRLPEFDWLVFSSSNGVHYFMNRLLSRSHDIRSLGKIKLAVVGPGTAEALAQYHLKFDLQPREFRAESLVDALAQDAKGKRFLLARASRGREILADGLRNAGGTVEQIVVYSSTDVSTAGIDVADLMNAGEIDWVSVTSSAIARSIVKLFGDSLRKCRIVSISPITSATLRELGHEPTAEATEYTMDGVVAAILKAVPS